MTLATLPGALNAQSGFTYIINNGTITITDYDCSASEVTIPSTIQGLPVSAIGDWAFFSCTNLSAVTIPDTVWRIGRSAFYLCRGLTNVTLPEGVTTIGMGAFSECRSLTNIRVPDSVTTLGGAAFLWCAGLTNVTIGSGITRIERSTFSACHSLTTVILPNNVTYLGVGAISGTNLAEVHFRGDAPTTDSGSVGGRTNLTIHYLPGTSGWGATFAGHPTAPWHLPEPVILDFGPSFGVRTNRFGFVVSWATNGNVAIEACTNLADDNWSPVSTNALVNGWTYFSDADWANHPSRIYRVRSP